MKVDENGMCTLDEEDSSYHSCNTKKNICSCYHAERNFLGEIGVCWGTKECEACLCGGDESKCDFYEYKRERATSKTANAQHIYEKYAWIPSKERLPDKTGDYLAVINGDAHEAYYDNKSNIWLDPVEEWEDWTRFVTHWMPLPETPKATQNISNADHTLAISWIPLKEHLPEKHKYVLARFKNNDMAVVCWFDGGKDVLLWKVMTDDGFCSDLESEPTHWMPLPEPPKEE
jgi:hypothetical protein